MLIDFIYMIHRYTTLIRLKFLVIVTLPAKVASRMAE